MIKRKMRRGLNKLRAFAIRNKIIKPPTKASVHDWKVIHQEFEFDFHKRNKFRQSDDFMQETVRLFESFGFKSRDFSGKTVVDIGAGSRLRGKYFSDAQLVAVEPLTARFIEEIEWCDLTDASQVFSVPAEEYIESLAQQADFVFSINVLDHCFDFEHICKNIYKYLARGGTAFLSFDSHLHKSTGHPLILTEDICTEIFETIGFTVTKFSEGFPPSFLDYHGRNGYDGKSASLNYILTRM